MRYLGLASTGVDRDIFIPVFRISPRELEITKSLIEKAISYTPHTTENEIVHNTLRTMNNQLEAFFKNKEHLKKAVVTQGRGHWTEYVDEQARVSDDKIIEEDKK